MLIVTHAAFRAVFLCLALAGPLLLAGARAEDSGPRPPAEPANPPPETTCKDLAITRSAIAALGGTMLETRERGAIGRALALYNAIPGEILAAADHLIVVNRAARGGALFFGTGGVICRVLAVPPSSWPDVRAAVLGLEV